MTRAEALTKALAAFDQIVADRERSNITAMLADGVDPDALDAFIGEGRATMRQSRKDYAAGIAELLDAEWERTTSQRPLSPDRCGHNADDFADFGQEQVDHAGNIAALSKGRTGTVVHGHEDAPLKVQPYVYGRWANCDKSDFLAVCEFSHVRFSDGRLKAGGIMDLHVPLVELLNGDVQQSVLVPVVEIAQDGQEGRQFMVRTEVRLHTLDGVNNTSADVTLAALAVSEPEMLRPEIVGAVLDNKHQVSSHMLGEWSSRMPLVSGNCIDEMVQSGAKVMDQVAEDKGPFLKGRLVLDDKDEAVSGEIRVRFLPDGVRVSVSPCHHFVFHRVGVKVGAAKLGMNTGQVGRHERDRKKADSTNRKGN